jgi:hypothetical protein
LPSNGRYLVAFLTGSCPATGVDAIIGQASYGIEFEQQAQNKII